MLILKKAIYIYIFLKVIQQYRYSAAATVEVSAGGGIPAGVCTKIISIFLYKS